MLAIILLCSFFMQLSASGAPTIVSTEHFLDVFTRRLRGEIVSFTTESIAEPSENLIIVHYRNFSGRGGSTADLLSMSSLLRNDDLESLIKTIVIDDPHGVLMRDGVFSAAAPDSPDLRTVGPITIRKAKGGSTPVSIYNDAMCLKKGPEAPGIDVATHIMFSTIFQYVNNDDLPIAQSEVIVMARKVFLASKFMEGDTLDSILNSTDRQVSFAYRPEYRMPFNIPRLQRLAIFFLLAVPEDCHIGNCRVAQIRGSEELELRTYDSDRSFGRPMVEQEDGISTRSHCVVFCFKRMLAHPIDARVYDEIMSSKFGIAGAGLRLLLENSYHSALQSKINHTAGETQTILGVPTDREALIGMSSRFNHFVRLVSMDRGRSLASIFAEVSPELDAIYRFSSYLPTPASPAALMPLSHYATHDFTNVLVNSRIIDRNRGYGSAPASTDAPLRLYLGTTEHNRGVLIDVVNWSLTNCETLDQGERAGITMMRDFLRDGTIPMPLQLMFMLARMNS